MIDLDKTPPMGLTLGKMDPADMLANLAAEYAHLDAASSAENVAENATLAIAVATELATELGPKSAPISWENTSGRYRVTLADGSDSERIGKGSDVGSQMIDAAGFDAADLTYASDTDGMLVDCRKTGRWALVQAL